MKPRSLKAIALLLEYPSAELIGHIDELEAVISDEPVLCDCGASLLMPFYQYLRHSDAYLLEENYVALFDRGRGTSLYLFEHVHGDSKDRGQAMVDLLKMYDASGFDLDESELPDYLPVFLEYLSLLEENQAVNLLREISHLIRVIGENLAQRGSHYYLLCSAALLLAGEAALNVPFIARDFGNEPEDFEQIDKAWEEAPVTFGGACDQNQSNMQSEAIVQFVKKQVTTGALEGIEGI